MSSPGIDTTRLIYAGRFADELDHDDVLTDWDLDPVPLRRRLRDCEELVLLDPLSFPLEALGDRAGEILLDVMPPTELDLDDTVAVLGEPLLAGLTVEDYLLVHDDERWGRLVDRFNWVASQRVAPDEPGIAAAYACLRRRWRDEGVVRVETPFGVFSTHAGDLITEQLREFGAHQRSDLAALLSLVRPGDVVVDVGAHIGTFTVPLARRVGPSGRVTAFEPAAVNRALLAENVEQNDAADVVAVRGELVGSEGGDAYRPTVPAGNTGAAAFESDDRTVASPLPRTTLDAWWAAEGRPPVEVLKIDVEGMELDVLRGAEELLSKRHPLVMVELDRQQLRRQASSLGVLLTVLDELGYRLFENRLERNRPDDEFDLQPTGRGSGRTDLFDVLAVHVDSDRQPSGSGRGGA